jgi:hypothetical protein
MQCCPEELLDAVAAGIAREAAVRCAPADAARLLGTFLAAAPQHPLLGAMAARLCDSVVKAPPAAWTPGFVAAIAAAAGRLQLGQGQLMDKLAGLATREQLQVRPGTRVWWARGGGGVARHGAPLPGPAPCWPGGAVSACCLAM